MMRRVVMALAAAAVVSVGSASTAAARGGFGGGHGGHPGGFNRLSPAGPQAFHDDHLGYFDHNRSGHDRFFSRRFSVYGGGYPYGYDGGCYSRAWTRWGWRWQYVCD